MKHLTDEERLALIEGRASSEAAEHAKACAECGPDLRFMRDSIARLENLSWPAPMRKRSVVATPWFRWAAAAAIILSTGFIAGRATGPSAAQIKAQVAQEVRETLRDDLREEILESVAARTRNPQPEVLALLNDIRQQQAANYVSLRSDLETLAANADAGLQSTRRKLLELATANDSNH